jgi:hypothetical protein
VLADALAVAGDPLAELIRVQCALARGGLTADERVTLHGREHALLAAHEDAWLGPGEPAPGSGRAVPGGMTRRTRWRSTKRCCCTTTWRRDSTSDA